LRSFQWRITLPIIFLIIASMTALGIYLTTTVRHSQVDNLRFHLEQEARITAEASLPSLLVSATVVTLMWLPVGFPLLRLLLRDRRALFAV